MTVTSLPNRRKIDANSTPTAPLPRIAIDARHLGQMDRLVARDDRAPVDRDAGHAARRRPGGDDDLARPSSVARRRRRSTSTRPPPASRPVPLIQSILFFLKRNSTPLVRPVTILSLRACTRAMSMAGVRAPLAERDAPLGGVLRDLQRVRVFEQRLGGNAAPVEARAAEHGLPLDDGGRQAELRGADRGDVAAGAGADDDEIVAIGHQGRRRAAGRRQRERSARRRMSRSASHGTGARRRERPSCGRRRCAPGRRRGPAAANYLRGRTASFNCFAMRALTTVLAGILIGSPVAGLRPSRALRF